MQYPKKNILASSPPVQKMLTWFAGSSHLSYSTRHHHCGVCEAQDSGWMGDLTCCGTGTVCPCAPVLFGLPDVRSQCHPDLAWELSPALAVHHHFHVQSWDSTLSHVCHAISECSYSCACPRVQVRLCLLLQRKSKPVISVH